MYKRILFLLFYTLLGTHQAFSNDNYTVYIVLDLNDCINCSVHLYELNKKVPKNNITILFKEKYKKDSALVFDKFGLNNTTGRIIFSDTLFEKYSGNTVGSSVTVVNDGKSVYNVLLKEIETDKFMSVLEKYSGCKLSVKENYTRYIFDTDSSIITYEHEFGRFFYIHNSDRIQFYCDAPLLEKIYKEYYGDDVWNAKYLQYQQIKKEAPAVAPGLVSARKVSDSLIAFVAEVKMIEQGDKEDNLLIKNKYFLCYYNTAGVLKNCFYLDDSYLSKEKYYLKPVNFIIEGDIIVMPIVADSVQPGSKCLSLFRFNAKAGKVVFDKILPFNLPENYIKYKLYHNLHEIIFKSGLAAYHFGNNIYDLNSNQLYELPVPEYEYQSIEGIIPHLTNRKPYSFFRIYDVSYKNDEQSDIVVLYKNVSDQLRVMSFNKKTGQIREEKIVIENWANLKIKGIPQISPSVNSIEYINIDGCVESVPF